MKRMIGSGLAVGLLALAVPAGASGTVSVTSTTRTGDTLRASGGSTFAAQPYLTVGTDASGDAPDGWQQTGGDLVKAEISGTLEDTLRFRVTVDQMLALVAGFPAYQFGWNFCVSGGSCYELNLTRVKADMANNTAAAPPHWYLFRCGNEQCTPANQIRVADGQAQVFQSDRTYIATVPMLSMGARPGDVITPKAVDAKGPVFSAFGAPYPTQMQRGSGDGIETVAPYRIPKREVSVTVDAPGQAPDSVGYTTTVTPAATGAWSATFDVFGRSGDHAVYAKACFGENNCAYAQAPVTL